MGIDKSQSLTPICIPCSGSADPMEPSALTIMVSGNVATIP
jgi:hypothetical protein